MRPPNAIDATVNYLTLAIHRLLLCQQEMCQTGYSQPDSVRFLARRDNCACACSQCHLQGCFNCTCTAPTVIMEGAIFIEYPDMKPARPKKASVPLQSMYQE